MSINTRNFHTLIVGNVVHNVRNCEAYSCKLLQALTSNLPHEDAAGTWHVVGRVPTRTVDDPGGENTRMYCNPDRIVVIIMESGSYSTVQISKDVAVTGLDYPPSLSPVLCAYK